MPFKTKLLDLAKKQIQGWHLPDHHFAFLVYFADDEQFLHIARGYYRIVDP